MMARAHERRKAAKQQGLPGDSPWKVIRSSLGQGKKRHRKPRRIPDEDADYPRLADCYFL